MTNDIPRTDKYNERYSPNFRKLLVDDYYHDKPFAHMVYWLEPPISPLEQLLPLWRKEAFGRIDWSRKTTAADPNYYAIFNFDDTTYDSRNEDDMHSLINTLQDNLPEL